MGTSKCSDLREYMLKHSEELDWVGLLDMLLVAGEVGEGDGGHLRGAQAQGQRVEKGK